MKLASRQWVLGLALLATLFATWQVAQQDEAAVVPAVSRGSNPARPVPPAANTAGAVPPLARPIAPASDKPAGQPLALPLSRLERSLPPPSTANPFAVKSFLPPPPPAPPPVQRVAEAPVAPPLPFSLAGKMQDDGGRWVYYLMHGEQSYAVSEGDMIDATYRLRGVENNNLVIEYTPLALKQFLPLGSEP